jgi:hypothetical protein
MRTPILASILVVSLASLTAGCGAKKAGGARSASSATASRSSQKTGSSAASNQSSAANQGGSRDGVACDASASDVAFCASDNTIAFCASGSWWLLDCSEVEAGAYCGQAGDTIDCFAE